MCLSCPAIIYTCINDNNGINYYFYHLVSINIIPNNSTINTIPNNGNINIIGNGIIYTFKPIGLTTSSDELKASSLSWGYLYQNQIPCNIIVSLQDLYDYLSLTVRVNSPNNFNGHSSPNRCCANTQSVHNTYVVENRCYANAFVPKNHVENRCSAVRNRCYPNAFVPENHVENMCSAVENRCYANALGPNYPQNVMQCSSGGDNDDECSCYDFDDEISEITEETYQ